MTLSIRQADANDLERLHQWSLKLHQHEQPQLLEAHAEFGSRLKQWLKNDLTNENSLALIGEVNSTPIGFVSGSIEAMPSGFTNQAIKGWIKLLWVEPDYRKSGFADQLVKAIESCFKECNVEYVECHFTSNNHLAEHYWKSAGYSPTTITAGKII